MPITPASARSSHILLWLYLCLFCVGAMVLVGGVTRLTESGLSIVQWKLISGILPPLSDDGWKQEFEAYQTSPEYHKKNTGMSVTEFKQIFWLEWAHRLLGRATGLVFAVPLLYFALRRKMDGPLIRRCVIAALLVGAQGGVGWIMVKSGLIDDPRVSPLKLSMHLCLAFSVFCHVLWTIWLITPQPTQEAPFPPRRKLAIRFITAMVFLQIIFGAWVAGMDAGMTYNTWPLMDGDFAPPGMMSLSPWHRNFIENIPQVQFQHRTFAFFVAGAVLIYVAKFWRRQAKPQQRSILALGTVVKLQFSLGVLTLLHVVPVGLASLHQMVALLLLALCLREVFLTRNQSA